MGRLFAVHEDPARARNPYPAGHQLPADHGPAEFERFVEKNIEEDLGEDLCLSLAAALPRYDKGSISKALIFSVQKYIEEGPLLAESLGVSYPNASDKIFGEKDYDSKYVLNVLGLPDHILFQESISKINNEIKNHRNFFAAILTSSNHGPYEIPPGISFKPRSTEIRKQLIEYADWSIGEFIKSAHKQLWFDKTIFIFTGDHGAIIGDMDMYLTFHHIPLIIYSPENISPEIKSELGGQIDIFPTIMGLLNQTYSNNSFGIDLLKEKRNLISYSYDDEFGAFSVSDFYINRPKNSSLFLINSEARYCKIIDNKLRADMMLNFSKAIFQTQQWLKDNAGLN